MINSARCLYGSSFEELKNRDAFFIIMVIIAPLYVLWEKWQDKKDLERSMERHNTFMAGLEAGRAQAEKEQEDDKNYYDL